MKTNIFHSVMFVYNSLVVFITVKDDIEKTFFEPNFFLKLPTHCQWHLFSKYSNKLGSGKNLEPNAQWIFNKK